MQIFEPHFRNTDSETLRVGPGDLGSNKASWGLLFVLKFKNHWRVGGWGTRVWEWRVEEYVVRGVLLTPFQ